MFKIHSSVLWRRDHPDRLPNPVSSRKLPMVYDGRGGVLKWTTEFTYECGHKVCYCDDQNFGRPCLICDLMERARIKEDIAARGVGTYQI